MDHLLTVLATLEGARADWRRRLSDEDGFSTAELLGNAALGIVALVVIWGVLRALGFDIVDMLRSELLTNNTPGGSGAIAP